MSALTEYMMAVWADDRAVCGQCGAEADCPVEVSVLLGGDDRLCKRCARIMLDGCDPTTDPDDQRVRAEIAEVLR